MEQANGLGNIGFFSRGSQVNRFVFVEGCDFVTWPPGGQLTFAKQLVTCFSPAEMVLVGFSSDRSCYARWTTLRLFERDYEFFSLGVPAHSSRKPLIPERVRTFAQLRRFRSRIKRSDVTHVFTQSPEALLALSDWGWQSICHRMAGTENPLLHSRYAFAKAWASVFESRLFHCLSRVDAILVCADEQTTRDFIQRSNGLLDTRSVRHFPTRVDTRLFTPHTYGGSATLRSLSRPLRLVTTGRINHYKGWQLIVDAFRHFTRWHDAVLVFVGDGEDRVKLEKYAREEIQAGAIRVTGFQDPKEVAKYLQTADLYLVGSIKEGWSLAMLEALACGNRIVCTDVSGAGEMVHEGVNGFIVRVRSPAEFANVMERALHLSNYEQVSRCIAERYSVGSLRVDVLKAWPALVD